MAQQRRLCGHYGAVAFWCRIRFPLLGVVHMEPVPSLPSKIKLHVPVRMGRWILSSNVCRVVCRLLHQPL